MKRREYKQENELYEFNHGYESTVHKYLSDDGEEVVFKKFKLYHVEELDKSILRNKEEKLEILSSLNIPFLADVKDLLFSNGELVGYTMPMVEGKELTHYSRNNEKIEELKLLKKIMFNLNDQGIFIGDFGEHNFILNNGKLTCLDIDNYRIQLDGKILDFDTKQHRLIHDFQRRCEISELIDRYCYNFQTICLMGRYSISRLNLWWLTKLPPTLCNNDYNWNTLEEMKHLGKDYHGYLLELKRRN